MCMLPKMLSAPSGVLVITLGFIVYTQCTVCCILFDACLVGLVIVFFLPVHVNIENDKTERNKCYA